jgi:hypothetical protein
MLITRLRLGDHYALVYGKITYLATYDFPLGSMLLAWDCRQEWK